MIGDCVDRLNSRVRKLRTKLLRASFFLINLCCCTANDLLKRGTMFITISLRYLWARIDRDDLLKPERSHVKLKCHFREVAHRAFSLAAKFNFRKKKQDIKREQAILGNYFSHIHFCYVALITIQKHIRLISVFCFVTSLAAKLLPRNLMFAILK